MNNSFESKMRQSGEKWIKRIQKLLTPKRLAVFLTVVYVVSLVPLLWIAKYNYPSADDYTNGSRCHQIWEMGGSVFRVIGEALLRTVDEWFTWRGCYTSSFLSALPPNIWGDNLYFLTPWLVLLTLSGSMLYLLHEILVKAMKADQYTSHSISMLVLLITVQCLYEQGRVEAFYWYSGAINYTFVYGLSLIFYGLLISAGYAKGKKRTIKLILASVMGFLTAGGNQMTMLNAAIVLLVMIGIMTYRKKWKEHLGLLFPIGSFFIGFLLAVIAPGNFVRAGAATGMNPLKAILVSLYGSLDLAVDEWTSWPLTVMVIAMVPLFWHIAEKSDFSFRYPVVVVFFGYGLVSAMLTPPLFALGNMEAGRIQSLLYFMYVLVLTLCVGYITGWAQKKSHSCNGINEKTDEGSEPYEEKKEYGATGIWCLLGCFVFLLFGSFITVIPEPHYYAATSAITDLSNGSAGTYGEEQRGRTELYHDRKNGMVEVDDLSEKPSLLFFSDITADESDWTNKGVARFYDLEAVVIKKDE